MDNFLFAQYILNPNNKSVCEQVNEQLISPDDCLIFLSSYTDNLIKQHDFSSINNVEEFLQQLQKQLKALPALQSLISPYAYTLGIQAVIIIKSYQFAYDFDLKNQMIEKFITVANEIQNSLIKNTFFSFFLDFYINSATVLKYRTTVDKIISLINTDIKLNPLLFNLPTLESEPN